MTLLIVAWETLKSSASSAWVRFRLMSMMEIWTS